MSSTRLNLLGQGTIYVGSGSITTSALAAGAEEDLTISDTNAKAGDVVAVSIINAKMETGMSIAAAWVSADGTISIRVSNLNGANALTNEAKTVYYTLIRS